MNCGSYLGDHGLVIFVVKVEMVDDFPVGNEVAPVLHGRLLLGLQLQEAERMLAGQERGDHGDHGADGRAQVGRVHEVIQTMILDEIPILRAEEASPFTDLQDDQVDQVDDGHRQ